VTLPFAAVEYHKKMFIKVTGKSQNTGAIVFSFTPENGESEDVKVTIPEDMGNNDITEAIEKEFKVALGDAYKVHEEDGCKVKIKALDKNPKFSVGLSQSNILGIALIIKKDWALKEALSSKRKTMSKRRIKI
jgi:hypothetical protein